MFERAAGVCTLATFISPASSASFVTWAYKTAPEEVLQYVVENHVTFRWWRCAFPFKTRRFWSGRVVFELDLCTVSRIFSADASIFCYFPLFVSALQDYYYYLYCCFLSVLYLFFFVCLVFRFWYLYCFCVVSKHLSTYHHRPPFAFWWLVPMLATRDYCGKPVNRKWNNTSLRWHITVFQDVMPCSVEAGCRRFVWNCSLQLQGRCTKSHPGR